MHDRNPLFWAEIPANVTNTHQVKLNLQGGIAAGVVRILIAMATPRHLVSSHSSEAKPRRLFWFETRSPRSSAETVLIARRGDAPQGDAVSSQNKQVDHAV